MLALRDLEPDDRDLLLSWRNRPDIAQHMYREDHIEPDEHAAWFTRAIDDPTRRYWIIQLDGAGVGLVNLYDIDRTHDRAYWAFYIAGSEVRGRGVGSFVEWRVLEYAFGDLGLHRLVCEVLATNDVVVRMHEGFGFQREGTLRQHIRKPSGFVDVVQLGMLHDEWSGRRDEVRDRLVSKGILDG